MSFIVVLSFEGSFALKGYFLFPNCRFIILNSFTFKSVLQLFTHPLDLWKPFRKSVFFYYLHHHFSSFRCLLSIECNFIGLPRHCFHNLRSCINFYFINSDCFCYHFQRDFSYLGDCCPSNYCSHTHTVVRHRL